MYAHMYVCMSVMLRNSNYVRTAHMYNHISGRGMQAGAYCWHHVHGDAACENCSSKSLRLSTSVRHLRITVLRPWIIRGRTAIPQVNRRRQMSKEHYCEWHTRGWNWHPRYILHLAIVCITHYTFHLDLPRQQKNSTFLSVLFLQLHSFIHQCAHARSINCICVIY